MDLKIDVSGIVLETERLILRGWCENDIHDFFEYASVDGVGEMAGWKHHETMEITRSILNNFISEKNVFAIVHKQDNKVIGSLGLHYSWANNVPMYKNFKVKELGYVLSKAYWGQGLMAEGVKAITLLCFREWGFDMLTCGHFLANDQSKKVIEKCGFQFERNGLYHAKQLGKDFETMEYVLKKESVSL